MSYWEMNLRPFVCILEIVSAICGDLFPFHRLFDLKNTGRPFYPIANYIRSNLGIVIAFVPICTSSCWNGDFFVSFETFFFSFGINFRPKGTHGNFTNAAYNKNRVVPVTVIRGVVKHRVFSTIQLMECFKNTSDVCQFKWMEEGLWVSFETFFMWIQYSSKRHTRQFHTRALHIINRERSQLEYRHGH